MKKIAVFTGTRAEYGLLYWLLKDIQADSDLELQMLVSGMHLSPEFGYTYKQIEDDGFIINEKVEMLLSSDSSVGTVKSIGLGVIGFADSLNRLTPDLLVILGDRFEALAVAQAAMIMRIPIVHLHGGEVTEGAYDDAIRHAITKLSTYHCVSTKSHFQRVVQLGENPNRVKNVGAIGLDHLARGETLSREELSHSLNFELDCPFFVVTYHPVTLANEPAIGSFCELLDALDAFQNFKVILTYPNADEGGRSIIPILDSYAASQPHRVLAIQSLGQKRYLSAVKNCSMVIGNSSSGIIEVPSYRVPTVNIGSRQKGRLAADSVLHVAPSRDDIVSGIKKSLVDADNGRFEHVKNPYGQGDSSSKVIKVIKDCEFDLVKSFYDLPFPNEL